jgi:hypothetical protein
MEPSGSADRTMRIVPSTVAQLPAMGGVLAGSHRDYPPFRYLFPDPVGRAQVLRRFFAATVRAALPHGAVDAAIADDGRLLGVAVWLPPAAFPGSLGRRRRTVPTLLQVARLAPRAFPRFVRMTASTGRLHPHERHWTLEAIGVASAAQGQGIGSHLMLPGWPEPMSSGCPAS